MKFSLAAFTGLVAVAAATPTSLSASSWSDVTAKCGLSDKTAKGVVDAFGGLLTAFKVENADKYLSATKFTDTSGSINFLSGQDLDAVTFPSKQAFIAGQGSQPPIGFELIDIDSVTCKGKDKGVIAFRWKATVGQRKTKGAKGINILHVTKEGKGKGVDGWVIETVFSEFNSAVWAIEFGGTCALPPRPTLARS